MKKSVLFIGAQTEINFVDIIIRKYYKCSNFNIFTHNSKNWAPNKIINFAMSKKNKVYDLIFCFLDKDCFTCYQNSIKRCANDNRIIPIYSTPCFEYWYVLAYNRNMNKPALTSKNISDYIPNYKKPNVPNIYLDRNNNLENVLSTNIRNSLDIIKLHEREHKQGIYVFDCNTIPQTIVHRIFKRLDEIK